MLTVNYVISQVFIVIAIILYALTFTLKTKRSVLFIGLLSIVLTIIAFILLGAYTGAAVNLVTMFRSLWFYIEEKHGKHTKLSLIIILILIIGATFFTYEKMIDLLPFAAGMIYTFACWQKNITLYRILGILVTTIDIAYDIQFNSIFGIVGKLIAIICAISSLIIYQIKKQNTSSISIQN